MYKRLSSDCFDIYSNEMFWTYHPPPTRETHKAPVRPRRNAHSFAQCIYSPWKTRFICPISLYDFFFAFSTIQPHLMACTLLKLNINPRLILRIVDFFLNRSQTTRFQAALSSSRSISYGSPQGGNLYTEIYLLFFLHSVQMTAQALTQHQS